KMPAHKAVQFARRLFIGKRDSNIAFCQASIFPGNEPGPKAKESANSKRKSQWQRGGNRRPRAIKKVNDKVEHCGTGSIAGVSQHTLRWQSGFILRKKVTTFEFAKNFRAARVALLWYLVRARASPIDARNLSHVFADSDCCLITNAIWASLIPRQY